MAQTPTIKLPEGEGFVTNLVATTNRDSFSLEGVTAPDTADLQVSVNGSAFASDPSLVRFDLTSFVVPNPDNYPEGLPLDPGLNTILVRAIDIVGGVSGSASAVLTRVRGSDVLSVDAPTAVRVRRKRNSVRILAAKPPTLRSSEGAPLPSTFRGFNVYASSTPAGATGYVKVNESLVIGNGTDYEEDIFPVASERTTWLNENPDQVRVRVTDLDGFGRETGVRLDVRYDVGAFQDNLRFQSTFEAVALREFLSFTHTRSNTSGEINADQFASIPAEDPLYYVVTAVHFDVDSNVEIESPYSQEVVGAPLVIDTTIRDLQGRGAFTITVDFLRAIGRIDGEISLIPGSVTRDIRVDPFASEAERLWFLLDFVHRSQSFLTLLQVDDPNGDGVSDPVATSAYKQALKAALGLADDGAVQTLLDGAFDKLAANANVRRLPGRPAVGQAVFFTTTRPAFDRTVPTGAFVTTEADTSLGIPAVRFRVGGTYVLPAASADAYYNASTRRYELTVDIVAETIGSAGNRPAGQIKSATGVNGLSVINTESTIFGSDRESNADLASRAMLAFVSVDAGTEGGYAATTAGQVGVLKAKIVKSGDPLMMRDYDPVRRKHIGGKVDIYVQGLRERQVTETFAFVFDIARDVTCQIVDLPTLTLRVLDSRVTPDTPLIEILDNVGQGLGVRNVTQGLDYDLTGVQVLDYQTFRLNPALPGQPVTGADDVLSVDYRFRATNRFVLSTQPVRRVTSVVGEVSGALTPGAGYQLFKTDDPLVEGESTIAKDYVLVTQSNGLPSGETIPVNDERHVLVGFSEEPLLSVGINTRTIRVFRADRAVEYAGPGSSAPDFDVLDGTPTTPARLVRTSTSTIPNGATVSVDYVHDENFAVSYVVNDLLQELQRTVNVKRHITADVLIKQDVRNSVDLETTIQLKPGAVRERVDPDVRSAVSLELNKKLIGQGIAQSDLIRPIDATEGVDYLVVPFARMAYADGSRRLRESVISAFVALPSLGLGGNAAYVLASPLKFPTVSGGGLETEHRGVFQDDEALTLVGSIDVLASAPRQAYILGPEGASIAGYSDTATLVSEGFLDPEDQATERVRRTANRVFVSLPTDGDPLDTPLSHLYAVSYVVRGDKGSKDIAAAGVESLDLGSFTVTYRS
jgi:Baseplate J-like protein